MVLSGVEDSFDACGEAALSQRRPRTVEDGGGYALEEGRAQLPLLPAQEHIDGALRVQIDHPPGLYRLCCLQVGQHAPPEPLTDSDEEISCGGDVVDRRIDAIADARAVILLQVVLVRPRRSASSRARFYSIVRDPKGQKSKKSCASLCSDLASSG